MEHEARDGGEAEEGFRKIGAELNAARLARGIQISELSQFLRISKAYLKDIEAGDFDALPGPTYVAGYLRSFAHEVGLDQDEIPQRYRALLERGQERPTYSFPVDQPRPQRSGAMMASIIVIFAVAGYGGWYALGKPDIVSSLIGDPQPEMVAFPQVESTVTEPDDLSNPDAEPVDLAAETVPAVVAPDMVAPDTDILDDGPRDGGAFDMADRDTGVENGAGSDTPGEGALADAAAPVVADEPDTVVAAAAPSVTDSDPETDPATNQLAGTDLDADSVDPAVMPAIDDSLADAASMPVTPSPETAPVLDGAPGEVDLAASEGAEPAGDAPVVDQDMTGTDRVAAAAPDDMDAQIGTGVAFARQRVPEMEITLRATGASWVEIIRNNGEEVMAGLMRNGETYIVDSRDRLYLSTGNAGGLELVFNDGTVRGVGESGEILRDLLLDATKLRNQF